MSARICPPCTASCNQGRSCPARDPIAPRFHRSLQDAFPGTSSEIEDADTRPMDREDRIVTVACAVTALAVLFLVVFA
jgi:hypothetical protein